MEQNHEIDSDSVSKNQESDEATPVVSIATGKKLNRKNIIIISAIVAIALIVSAVAVTLGIILGGNDDGDGEEVCTEHVDADKNGKCDECGETMSVTPGQKTTYTISVKTAGGMPIEGATVVVYADNTLDDMEGYATTGSNGVATVSLYPSNSYAIELSGIPDGYEKADYYSFNGTSAVITLTSKILPDKGLSNVKYSAGDIMRDFTVTTIDNEKVTLSELFASGKKLVMLNFWYIDCSACVMEFPCLDESYEKFADDVAVIALNPNGGDDLSEIGMFRNQYELSFHVAQDRIGLANAFGVTNYPTSVFIDRYGAITFIEVGALTETKYFDKLFQHYTAEPYVQKLINNYEDIAPVEKPDIDMPSSDEIAAVISPGNDNITYYPETGADKEYSWPFIIGEKDGVPCIKTSNAMKDSSFATMYADVTLKAGQVLEMDVFVSSESGADLLYVLVDGVSIFTISGEGKSWETRYPYVATEDGTYQVSFLYLKDSTTDAADDTVYIKSLTISENSEINTPTYIPRWAATVPNSSGIGYDKYITPVFNENDGYYHVNSANGPLLLANLMGVTQFSSEDSVYSIVYLDNYKNGPLSGYYDEVVTKYCSYASNAAINGLCTVDARLAEILTAIADEVGYEENNDKQWLQFCLFYDAYGTGGKELEDPIAGLSAHSAYKAVENETLGLDEYPNIYNYDRPIMPKGLWFEFTPTKSGAYRIASNEDKTNEIAKSLLGWIFLEDGSLYYEYAISERIINDSTNVFMYAYLEAGKSYYIDIAYYDIYTVDSFGFKIEYLGESYEHFRAVSPGAPFTYEVGKGYELYEMDGTLIEGGNAFYASITTNGSVPAQAYYDEIVYILTRDEAASNDTVEVYIGKDKSGNAYLTITIDTVAKTVRFQCTNPALTDASPDDKTVKYKEVDAEVTDKIITGGTKVVYDETEDRYYNVLPDGTKGSSKIYADLTFFTGVFSNKSLIAMINPAVIFKDASGNLDRTAGMLSLNLYNELKGDGEYSYVKSAIFNGVSYSGFTKLEGAANELAGKYVGYQKPGAETQATSPKLVVTIDNAGNATLEQYDNPAAAATITKQVAYQLISFAFNFAVTENDHNGLIYLVNYPTDDALREYWGEDYEENMSIYQMDDLKKLKFHGRGEDYTSVVTKYAEKMITKNENPMDPDSLVTEYPTELQGCVEVTKELAEVLQKLMDKYTFEGVKDSWVKLCYYYETIGAGWKYISPLR